MPADSVLAAVKKTKDTLHYSDSHVRLRHYHDHFLENPVQLDDAPMKPCVNPNGLQKVQEH